MKVLSSLFVLFFGLAALAAGSQIHVPGDQPTIQAGIDAALADDTVVIAEGTWSGPGNRDLVPGGKVLTMLGDGLVEIDCAGPEPHFGLSINDTLDLVTMVNLAITNAADTIGAVRINLGEAILRHCTIYGNQTDGLRVTIRGSATVDSCYILDNTGRGISVGELVWPYGNLAATWTTIAGNGEDGVYFRAFDQATIENCTVVGNGVTGIYMEGDPPKNANFQDLVIQRCLVYANGSVGLGRGFIGPAFDINCNNSFANGSGQDYYNLPVSAGDTSGNISQDPLILPGDIYPSFRPTWDSPCAPPNNGCGVLMGAWAPADTGCTCWGGLTGDLDRSGEITLTDLTLMINHLFVTFEELPCPATVNTSGDAACERTLTDLTRLVNHLFVTFENTAYMWAFDNCACL